MITVDDEQSALADTLLLAIDVVGARGLALWMEVSEERKVNLVLRAEGLMTPDTVNRYAEQLRTALLKELVGGLEHGQFVAANWTPIGRIKNEHDWPVKLGQTYRLVGGR